MEVYSLNAGASHHTRTPARLPRGRVYWSRDTFHSMRLSAAHQNL